MTSCWRPPWWLRGLTVVAWALIVVTALWALWEFPSAIDDGNPNTRDGWMGSWALVVLPPYLVGSLCNWLLGMLTRASRRRYERRHPQDADHVR